MAGTEVGIRDLKNNLSRYLEKVKAGQPVVVTDRGKPVARIEPVGEMTNFERMCAEGKITPAKRPKRPNSEHPPPYDFGLEPDEIERILRDFWRDERGRDIY